MVCFDYEQFITRMTLVDCKKPTFIPGAQQKGSSGIALSSCWLSVVCPGRF
jgi:hypothetical protein